MIDVKKMKQRMISVLKDEFGDREASAMARLYFEDLDMSSFADPWKKLETDLLRLMDHYPLQYITGKVFFYDTFYQIKEGVLIPRPETEELVSLVIKENSGIRQKQILDIGVGSGCIILSIARHLNTCRYIGIDFSSAAIDLARLNSQYHGIEVDLIALDFLDTTSWPSIPDIDIIVSNPPYVRYEEKEKMSVSTLKFEPSEALFPSHHDPLIFYKKIAEFSRHKLNPHGKIYLEINEFLADETLRIYNEYGFRVEIIEDMQGKPRILKATKD